MQLKFDFVCFWVIQNPSFEFFARTLSTLLYRPFLDPFVDPWIGLVLGTGDDMGWLWSVARLALGQCLDWPDIGLALALPWALGWAISILFLPFR